MELNAAPRLLILQVFKDLVRHDFTLVDENSMLCRICKAATADCLSENVSSGVDFQTSRKTV